MKRSETNTTSTSKATIRSSKRNAIPSLARRRSPWTCRSGLLRTASESPAAPTTTNDTASTPIAAAVGR
jgi:hypothetical protein